MQSSLRADSTPGDSKAHQRREPVMPDRQSTGTLMDAMNPAHGSQIQTSQQSKKQTPIRKPYIPQIISESPMLWTVPQLDAQSHGHFQAKAGLRAERLTPCTAAHILTVLFHALQGLETI